MNKVEYSGIIWTCHRMDEGSEMRGMNEEETSSVCEKKWNVM